MIYLVWNKENNYLRYIFPWPPAFTLRLDNCDDSNIVLICDLQCAKTYYSSSSVCITCSFACPFTRAGYGSESEPDDEAATVSLASDIDKLNRASRKSAVRLQEIGPRMTMRLVKVESGLCSGDVLYPQSGKFHVLPSWFHESPNVYSFFS